MASSQTGSSASYLCWTLDVGRSALATPKLSAYAGSTFFFRHGRVAESGLRHSTRNRAWGNPPWVRIPPLPRPSQIQTAAEKVHRSESVANCVTATKLAPAFRQPAMNSRHSVRCADPSLLQIYIIDSEFEING